MTLTNTALFRFNRIGTTTLVGGVIVQLDKGR